MYNILNPVNRFDASAFQFAKMTYVRQRVDENYQKYLHERNHRPGRVDSSHLLFKILLSLNTPFEGDMMQYMDRVDAAARQIVPTIGMTSSFSKGRLYTEGLFYDRCPEIILYVRDRNITMMDLWNDWRGLEPVKVINHPVSSLLLFEPAVMNSAQIEKPDLAVISIDIPLMAAQYKMFRTAFPDRNREAYVTEVLLPSMLKSHLNVALFNKVMVQFGVRSRCDVKTNLPFAQNAADDAGNDVVNEVVQKLLSKRMTANQVLATIPSLYGNHYLESVTVPSMPPTHQVLWALISHKVDPAALVLEVGKRMGYDQMLREVTNIKRTVIVNKEDKTLSNGLSTAASIFLEGRLNDLVLSRLPA